MDFIIDFLFGLGIGYCIFKVIQSIIYIRLYNILYK